MAKDFNKLIQKIDKKEEVKEEKDNLDEQLHLLKQAVTNLQYCVMKVEKADKDGVDMVTAMNAATDSMDTAVFAFCRAVTRAESTVLQVEMTDKCKNEIISARDKLIKAETNLLSSHRDLMLRQIRDQNEELQSFIKDGKGAYLSPKVFWWWIGISYVTSLYSLWNLLQLFVQWWKS